MRKKSVGVLLAALAAFLLLTSGFFLGRNTVRGVKVSAERSVEAYSASEAATEETADRHINLNTATVEELQQLPMIGKTIAERIVSYREQHGAFASVSELINIEGIGQARYEAIKDFVTVR